jgi:transaldolase
VVRDIKIFADGADLVTHRALRDNPLVDGVTTNPTLMHAAGVRSYEKFAWTMAAQVAPKPISLEVFADDFDGMLYQARTIASWGDNIYVKIPVTNTEGVSSARLISQLVQEGLWLNVTAVFTFDQVVEIADALGYSGPPAIVSVFAGRIADAGQDPASHMRDCAYHLRARASRAELLWASPRQVYDLCLAEKSGCNIITMTPDLLKKIPLLGKDLGQYSLETVQMFHRDALSAGFKI